MKLKDFVKVTKTRKRRGWEWEDTLVKRIKSCHSYEAFRLGGASQILPDVLAISNKFSKILVIEAKSGTTEYLVVKKGQIEHLLKFADTFKLYSNRYLILAFKFLRKRRLKRGSYEKRELKEYYKEFNLKFQKCKGISDIICTYDGSTYAISKGEKKETDLPDFKMPFQK